MRKQYDPTKKEEILQKMREGISPRKVHLIHKVPIGTLARWAKEANLKFRFTQNPEPLILDLIQGDRPPPIVQVAKKAKTTSQRVAKVFATLGIESPKCRARRLRPEGIRMLKEGVFPTEVVKILQVKIQTVSAWKSQAGITTPQRRRTLPEETRTRAIEMIRMKMKIPQISKELGVSPPTIRKWELQDQQAQTQAQTQVRTETLMF